MMKRVFLIVLDSCGIGYEPDADLFGDVGANTLKRISASEKFNIPTLIKMGIGNIDGVEYLEKCDEPMATVGRLREVSMGKDTTIGHWEIAGIVSKSPLPTYPNGFPKDVISEFEAATGRKVICNKPYSGTDVIRDYGKEHVQTGALIVYTSADSVFQIAAHEELVPVETLYEYCHKAREILQGEHGVGRVIARPFTGSYPFERTPRRHDYSLTPPSATMADVMKKGGFDVISVGKIYDIFAGKGFTESYPTSGNEDGMDKTLALAERDFNGLCFINLVDFDMVYGHRNNIEGYARAMSAFDKRLGELLPLLKEDDLLIITADHGCDPATPSTDHSRECTPMLAYGEKIKQGVNLGTRDTFADIGATILEWFDLPTDKVFGKGFLKEIKNA